MNDPTDFRCDCPSSTNWQMIDGSCTCPIGYQIVLNPPSGPGDCNLCPIGASSTENSSSCFCANGFEEVQNGGDDLQCYCPAGRHFYYDTSDNVNKCIACDSESTGVFYVQDDGSQPECRCGEGMDAYTENGIFKCRCQFWLAPYIDSNGHIDHCYACLENESINDSGLCECPPNYDYYYDSDSATQKCEPCPSPSDEFYNGVMIYDVSSSINSRCECLFNDPKDKGLGQYTYNYESRTCIKTCNNGSILNPGDTGDYTDECVCPTGTFRSNNSCQSCPQFYTSEIDDTDCNVCDNNLVKNGQECVCTDLRSWDGISCQVCPFPKVSSVGVINENALTTTTSTCVCPSEGYVSNQDDECECASGYGWNSESSQCFECPAGVTSNGGYYPCNICINANETFDSQTNSCVMSSF